MLNRAFRQTGWLGIVVPVFLLTVLLLVAVGSALATTRPVRRVDRLAAGAVCRAGERGRARLLQHGRTLFLKPTRLVGYEFKDGVPAEARTLVVVPSLIGSRDDVEENIRKLEVHHLANMTGEIHFALLSDWPDSAIEQSSGDEEILDFARAEIARLNAALSHARARRASISCTAGGSTMPAQKCWMGWERKRGKLHELNLLLRGDTDTTFLPPDAPLPEDVVHVMTLDADTRMMRDAVAASRRQALPPAQPSGHRCGQRSA